MTPSTVKKEKRERDGTFISSHLFSDVCSGCWLLLELITSSYFLTRDSLKHTWRPIRVFLFSQPLVCLCQIVLHMFQIKCFVSRHTPCALRIQQQSLIPSQNTASPYLELQEVAFRLLGKANKKRPFCTVRVRAHRNRSNSHLTVAQWSTQNVWLTNQSVNQHKQNLLIILWGGWARIKDEGRGKG